ncbi:MAG TPA: hypothetical protein VLF14_04500 [Candidatus Binatia bacterium]|nr:hypothetical protein [Candidatus Binatia bacterium]
MTGARPRQLSFYRRLSAAQKREYDRSDARSTLPLAPAPALAEATAEVVAAIASESPAKVCRAAQRLVDEICARLSARSARRIPPPPRVKVLRLRPRLANSEFHGLYTRSDSGESEIKVWMFTAAHGHVVKARTFLRTLLHEVCHHVDMTLLDLPHSLHTLGFHARESSLLRSLERSGADIPGRRAMRREPPEAVRGAPVKPPRAVQLELFSSARSSNARRRGRGD